MADGVGVGRGVTALVSPRELFHSSRLYPFQVAGAAEAYARTGSLGSMLAVWETGVGKTVLAMMLAALLVADGEVDTVLVVAEAGKVDDWVADFGQFTTLRVADYTGPRRTQLLHTTPQVLVTSYETAAADICTVRPRSHAVAAKGVLTGYLETRRVLVVYDEVSKLGNRRSLGYLAQDYLLNRVLRKRTLPTRVLALTATTVGRSPVSHFNLGRLLAPGLVPTVAAFERDYVKAWHPFREGEPSQFKNLSTTDWIDHDVVPLATLMAPLLHRKRKTDDDVAGYFPRRVEHPPTMVDLTDLHHQLIDAVHEHFGTLDEQGEMVMFGLQRMIAGYPSALITSEGEMAAQVVGALGEGTLRAIRSAKVDRLLEWAAGLGSSQGVVFTFYGRSILPLLRADLERAGHSVVVNHGTMTRKARQEAKRRFVAGEAQVFLSSDAGARGISLGCADHLLHYEPPLTHETFEQRSNRIHRIDSYHSTNWIDTLVARDTIDEPAMGLVLRRNEWADALVDSDLREGTDPGVAYLPASERRRMMKMAKDTPRG